METDESTRSREKSLITAGPQYLLYSYESNKNIFRTLSFTRANGYDEGPCSRAAAHGYSSSRTGGASSLDILGIVAVAVP